MVLKLGDLAGDRGGAAPRAPRIAIIDSGVHAAHPHVQGVSGGIGVDDGGALHADYVDRLGHGTAVTAVIREKAPEADIWAIKVFDRELTATGPALVAALQWARAQSVDLINLSLGTTNPHHEEALRVEVDEACHAGIVIVCAGPQPERRWLPGALPGVVRVAVDMSMARDACDVTVYGDGGVSIKASGYPRPIPGVPPERNLMGVSFAVANVTGIVAHGWPAWLEWIARAR